VWIESLNHRIIESLKKARRSAIDAKGSGRAQAERARGQVSRVGTTLKRSLAKVW
jgi:hypothetical protein